MFTTHIIFPFSATTVRQNTSRCLLAVAISMGLFNITSVQAASDHAAPTTVLVAPDISLAAKDWLALRKWFHQPQFNITDGLDVYNEHYPSATRLARLRNQSALANNIDRGQFRMVPILQDK